MMATFVKEATRNNADNMNTTIKGVTSSIEFHFHRLHDNPKTQILTYALTPPKTISITAKFITRYMLRLRRLRFLIKTIIVQRFNVTIATDAARNVVIQGMHSDKDSISKLCPRRNYLSVCGKKIGFNRFFTA